jgi:hypothetical protein
MNRTGFGRKCRPRLGTLSGECKSSLFRLVHINVCETKKQRVHVLDQLNCSPAAYQCFAPTGGCLYEKQLDLFFPFVSIPLKRNFNAIGYFLSHYYIVNEK